MGGDYLMENHYEIFNQTEENLEEEINTLQKLLAFACKFENVENAEFNIIFVGKDMIQEVNKTYRGVDRVTDVISFALEDNKTIDLNVRLLGDIYICIEKAHEQAVEYGHSFLREICFLSIHGFLHLLGYDHMKKEEEGVMFRRQEEILDEFGIKRGTL